MTKVYPIVKTTVVEVEILAQARYRLGHAFVVVQIDFFVFDATP